MPKRIEVEIRGTTYPSITAAARALNLAPQTVYAAWRRKTLDRVGMGSLGPRPMRLRFGDLEFESVRDAAAYFGRHTQTIRSWINEGKTEIAPPRRVGP